MYSGCRGTPVVVVPVLLKESGYARRLPDSEEKMKQHCNYHPTKVAHFVCPECGVLMCPDCVSKRDKGGYLANNEVLHFCPKCNKQAEWVGAANILDPFWNRLPKLFLYPLSLNPIIVGLIFAAGSSLLPGLGLISTIVLGVLWMLVLKYSFESLKATAKGDLRPPQISAETISDDFGQVFKQLAIYFIIFFGFGWLAATTGIVIAALFMLFSIFFIPAMVILLVTTGSLLQALNPAMFIRLTFRIGWGYLLMYFFLILLGAAPAVVAQFVVNFLPEGLHLFLFSFAKAFYTIISYHLMGYVILQYHDRIGYEVEYDDFRDPSVEAAMPAAIDPDEAILAEVTPLIQDGELDEAITLIQQRSRQEGIKGSNLSERYYNLLKMRKRTKDLIKHGVKHLEILAAANERNKALLAFAECRKIYPKFLPEAPALFKLGDWMNETGKTKEAVSLYNLLIKSHADSPLVPKAYFRAAQIFNDRLMSTDKARKILNLVKAKYPSHEIVPKVDSYLAHIS